MPFFLKGWIVGFIVGSPIGPVGVLGIRRTLLRGRLVGLLTVLGTATADAVYGLIAALGLTFVSRELAEHRTPLRIGAGLFLLFLGWSMMRARPAETRRQTDPAGLAGAYFSALLLMLANPFIVLSFLAVFSALGFEVHGLGDLPASGLFGGLFLGSASWWAVFSLAAGWLRPRLREGGLRAINVGAGLLMWAFGLWQFAELFLKIRT